MSKTEFYTCDRCGQTTTDPYYGAWTATLGHHCVLQITVDDGLKHLCRPCGARLRRLTEILWSGFRQPRYTSTRLGVELLAELFELGPIGEAKEHAG